MNNSNLSVAKVSVFLHRKPSAARTAAAERHMDVLERAVWVGIPVLLQQLEQHQDYWKQQ